MPNSASSVRAVITFTDGQGNSWEYELTPLPRGGPVPAVPQRKKPIAARPARPTQPHQPTPTTDPDFSVPLSPFIKRHTKGASGPKKFAILVARLAKGDTKAEVPFTEIEKQWNRMTRLMGGPFNPSHSSRAKDNGWVDSPKKGVYKLRSEWRAALPDG